MSSITNTEAADISRSHIPEHYFLDCRPTSQLFRVLPFVPIEGHSLTLNMVVSGMIQPEAPPWPQLNLFAGTTDGADPLEAGMPQIEVVEFPIKRLSAELHIDGIISGIYGSVNNIVHELIKVKVEAVRDQFKAMLIRGTGTSNEFAGLKALTQFGGPLDPITTGLTLGFVANSGAGGTVQPGEIEKLLGLLNPRAEPGSSFLVMHAKAYEHLRRNSYPDAEYVLDDDFGPVPTIAGITVLIDNFVPTDESYAALTTTSIYAVTVGEGKGLCGIYPASNKGDEIQVRGPYVKETKDRKYYHVTWDVGLACFNSGAIARLEGVQYAN